MFSGKTEELIRRIRRAQIARQSVVVLKPFLDTRFDSDHLVSHNAQRVPSMRVKSSEEVLELGRHSDVVGIDEVQFLDDEAKSGVLVACETSHPGGVIAPLVRGLTHLKLEVHHVESKLSDGVRSERLWVSAPDGEPLSQRRLAEADRALDR